MFQNTPSSKDCQNAVSLSQLVLTGEYSQNEAAMNSLINNWATEANLYMIRLANIGTTDGSIVYSNSALILNR